MARRVELEVEGVTAIARLLEDEAPGTVERFWNVLPVEQTLRHVSWAGNAAFIRLVELDDPDFPLENRVSFYPVGSLNYRPENVEVAMAYGQAQARTLLGHGGNLWANNFGVLEGDARPFLEMLERTQSDGAKRLTIRRKED